MKIQKLNEIENCLTKVLLPVKGTGLSYEINKNLVEFRKKQKDFFDRLDLSKKDHEYKNNKEESIEFLLKRTSGEDYQFVLGEDGQPKEAAVDYVLAADEAKSTRIKMDKDYTECIKKYNEEEIDVNIHTFSKEKIEKLFAENTLDGLDLTCLFGTLIAD